MDPDCPAPPPEINVTGNSVDIADGDTTPSEADHTILGSANAASGTVARTFTIENTGLGALTVSDITSSNAAFTVSDATGSIAAGGSTTFTVTHDPDAIGAATAVITVTSDDADEASYDFEVLGVGTGTTTQSFPAAPTLLANGGCTAGSPTSFVFSFDVSHNEVDQFVGETPRDFISTYLVDSGNQVLFRSTGARVTGDSVTNGSAGLQTSATPTGGPFRLIGYDDDATLEFDVGDTYVSGPDELVTLEFDPNALDSDCPAPLPPEINVTGNSVTIADGDTSPNTSDHTLFDAAVAASGTSTRTFTIQNTGSGPLTITSITRSGSHSSDFTVTSSPTSPVAAGGSTTFTVTFDPSAVGVRNATLTVNTNDADEAAYDFAIRGAGTGTTTGSITDPPWVDTDGACSAATPTRFGVAVTVDAQEVDRNVSNADPFDVVHMFLVDSDSTVIGRSILNIPVGAVFTRAYLAANATKVETTNTPAFGPFTAYLRNDRDNSYDFALGATFIPSADDLDSEQFDANALDMDCPGPPPEINVTGNSVDIADGDTTPASADDTDFGEVLVAGGTDVHTFTIENTGAGTLTVSAIASDDAQFAVTHSVTTISAGGSDTFTVTFDPASTGSQGATITITSDDVDEGTYTFDVAGTGAAPEINVTGNSVDIADGDTTPDTADHTDFEGVNTSGSLARTYTIENPGTSTLTISSIVSSGDEAGDFVVSGAPSTVAAGGSETFDVTFTPGAIGLREATITVNSDDADEAAYDFAVRGVGTGTTTGSVNAPTLLTDGSCTASAGTEFRVSFGFTAREVDYYDGVTPRDLVVLYMVDGDGTVFDSAGWTQTTGFARSSQSTMDQLVTPVSGPFVVYLRNDDDINNREYNPGDTYVPSGNDLDSETFNAWLLDADCPGPEVNLVGASENIADGDTTPRVEDDTDFGSLQVAGGTDVHTFTVQNTGAAPLTVSAITSDDAQFAVTHSVTTISAGGSDTFTVTFDPASTGAQSATITITSDDADEGTYTFDVAGTGTAPEINVTGNSVDIADGDTTPATADDTDFGDVLVAGGTDVHTFTIENTGAGTLTVSSIASDDAQFAVTHSVTTISAGGSDTFTVTFDPASTGAQSATITITSDDADEGTYTFDVAGTGTAPEINVTGNSVDIADGDTTPATADDTDFGDVLVAGGSDAHTFTIENTGDATLTVNSIVSSDAQFEVAHSVTTIAAGGNDTFTVTFDPASLGTQSATITIESDDADEATYTFDVRGVGTGPASGSFTSSARLLVDGGCTPASFTFFEIDTSITYGQRDAGSNVDYLRIILVDDSNQILSASIAQNQPGVVAAITPNQQTAATPARAPFRFVLYDVADTSTFASPGDVYTGTGSALELDVVSFDPSTLDPDCPAIDASAPELSSFTRQTPSDDATNADSLVFRATFSESVDNVTTDDFAVNGTTTATVSSVSAASGATIDVTVSGGDLADFDGAVGLDLAAGQDIADPSGNALPAGEPSTDETYTLDNTAPELTSFTRVTPADEITNADSLVFRATFSESVDNVTTDDFAVNGTTTATVSSVSAASGATVDVTVSGGDLADFNGAIGLDLAAGQDIADPSGNALPAGEPSTDETYTLDNSAPELTSFTRVTPADEITNADSLVFRATFSESVDNVTMDDFAVNGTTTATVSAVSASSGATIDVAVSGGDLSDFDGAVGLNLAAGQDIADPSGNALPAGEPTTDETYTLDNTAPTPTITPPASPTNADPFTVAIDFGEAVTGFASGDITVGNGAVTALSDDGGGAFTATIDATADGTVTIDIAAAVAQDDAGNDNDAADQASVTVDTAGPTPTITPPASPTNADPFTVAIDFGEAVSGFASGDITVGNGAVTALSDDGGGAFTATIDATADGTVTIDIAAAVAQDDAGNDNDVADQASVTVDTAGPTPTITPPASPTNADPFTVAIDFGEAVSGFEAGDITVGNGAVTALSDDGGGAFTATIDATADGTVTIDIAAAVAQDDAGNDNDVADQASVTVDTGNPEVTLTTGATGPVTAAFTVTATFDEAVTGFALADVSFGNATGTDFSGSDDVYTFTVTPDADGTVTVDVAADVADDAAGNGNAAASQFSIAADITAPGVASVTPDPATVSFDDVGAGGFTLTVLFDEAMDVSADPTLGFPVEDPAATLSFASGVWSGDALSYVATYDVTNANQAVTAIDVSVSGVSDAAGNPLGSVTAPDVFAIDMAGGTIVIEKTALGGDGAFTFTSTGGVADAAIVTSGGAGAATFVNVTPGSYDLTEALTSGFELTDLVCADPDSGTTTNLASRTASIDLDNGETVTCTFTNTAKGGITIEVATLGQDGAFPFSGDLGVFSVTTSSLAGSEAFASLDTGTYAVTFDGLDGFDLTDLSCTGDADGGATVDLAAGTASIDLDAGEAIVCAFEATAEPEVSVPPETTVALTLPDDFDAVTGFTADVPITNAGGAPLDYAITVDVDWLFVDPTSGTIAAGDTVTFTVGFTDAVLLLPPGPHSATITIVNESTASFGTASIGTAATNPATVSIPVNITVAPRDGDLTIAATTAPQPAAGDASFAYASAAPALDGVTLTTSGGQAATSAATLRNGMYEITQTTPEGWRLDAISCAGDADGGSVVDLAAGSVQVDLDPEETITCTFANVRDEAFVIAQTQRVIRSFMVNRADRILQTGPQLTDRLRARDRASAGGFAADFTDGRANASVSFSLAGAMAAQDQAARAALSGGEGPFTLSPTRRAWPEGLDIWIEGTWSSVSDDRAGLSEESDFAALYLGADYLVNERLLIGALIQMDWMDTTSETLGSAVSGDGWMIGPYAVLRLSDALFADVRAAWGRSDNDVNPLGTYEDTFDTERLLFEARLAGDVAAGRWRFQPEAGLSYFGEEQDAYTDSLGIAIPSQDIEILRLRTALDVAYRFEGSDGAFFEPFVGLGAIYDFDPGDVPDATGDLIEFDDVRASLRAGLSARFAGGATLTGAFDFDGVGEDDFDVASGRLVFTIPLQRGGRGAGGAGAGAGFATLYDPYDEAGLTGWLDGVAFAPNALDNDAPRDPFQR